MPTKPYHDVNEELDAILNKVKPVLTRPADFNEVLPAFRGEEPPPPELDDVVAEQDQRLN